MKSPKFNVTRNYGKTESARCYCARTIKSYCDVKHSLSICSLFWIENEQVLRFEQKEKCCMLPWRRSFILLRWQFPFSKPNTRLMLKREGKIYSYFQENFSLVFFFSYLQTLHTKSQEILLSALNSLLFWLNQCLVFLVFDPSQV